MKAFEFIATFGGNRAPYKILSDGVVLMLELPEQCLEQVTALYTAGKNKHLRLLIEVTEPQAYLIPKEQTKWIKDDDESV